MKMINMAFEFRKLMRFVDKENGVVIIYMASIFLIVLFQFSLYIVYIIYTSIYTLLGKICAYGRVRICLNLVEKLINNKKSECICMFCYILSV